MPHASAAAIIGEMPKWGVRAVSLLAVVALAGPMSLAGGAAAPPVLSGLTAWATAGSQLAFVATAVGDRRGYLWVASFGSMKPRLLRDRPPLGQEEIDQLAAGPDGTWGCLERTEGNTEAFYSVDLVSSTGAGTHVATAGGPRGPGQPAVDSIPLIFGDGSFLGYLYLTGDGRVQLMRITPTGKAVHVADLPGVGAPEAVAIAGGHLAVLHEGRVSVYTTAGRKVATIAGGAASVALMSDRVVVRARDRHLLAFTLDGRLLHSYVLAAACWSAGLAARDGYAVYLGANKAVRLVDLSTGSDRVVARSGTGWFFNGLSFESRGVIVPQTTQRGRSFPVTLRFLPLAALQETGREQRELAALIARRLPVYCAGGRRHAVALTFDDGPSAETSRLVSLLRSLRAPATFFEIGANAAHLPQLTRLEGTVGRSATTRRHTQRSHEYPTHVRGRRSPRADAPSNTRFADRSTSSGRPETITTPPPTRWSPIRAC
jgi:hypothetical protein